jgi:hypothetical protein
MSETASARRFGSRYPCGVYRQLSSGRGSASEPRVRSQVEKGMRGAVPCPRTSRQDHRSWRVGHRWPTPGTHAPAEGCGHLDVSVQLIAESSASSPDGRGPLTCWDVFSAYARTTPGAGRGPWQRWRRSHASECNDAWARAKTTPAFPRQTSACMALSARSPWTIGRRVHRRRALARFRD